MNEGIGPQMHSSSWVAATPPWSTPIFLRSCTVTLQNVDSERARKSPVSARMMSPATSPALSAGGINEDIFERIDAPIPGTIGNCQRLLVEYKNKSCRVASSRRAAE